MNVHDNIYAHLSAINQPVVHFFNITNDHGHFFKSYHVSQELDSV